MEYKNILIILIFCIRHLNMRPMISNCWFEKLTVELSFLSFFIKNYFPTCIYGQSTWHYIYDIRSKTERTSTAGARTQLPFSLCLSFFLSSLKDLGGALLDPRPSLILPPFTFYSFTDTHIHTHKEEKRRENERKKTHTAIKKREETSIDQPSWHRPHHHKQRPQITFIPLITYCHCLSLPL